MRDKIEFNVNSATADSDDDAGDPKEADCDATCAGNMFRESIEELK